MLPPSPSPSPSLQHGTPAQHKCCLVSSLIEPQPAGWVGGCRAGHCCVAETATPIRSVEDVAVHGAEWFKVAVHIVAGLLVCLVVNTLLILPTVR